MIINTLYTKHTDYETINEEINFLNAEELINAVKKADIHYSYFNSTIQQLFLKISAISAHVSHSFTQKLWFQGKIKALVIQYGLPAF